jgi:diadenosine tetraphosphatase ApaH/serine/threonine PP2A family protein phosphatase
MTSSDAIEAFASFREDICFIGHSHIMEFYEQRKGHPLVRQLSLRNQQELILEEDKRYIINVGSVGQPRDRDPRAGYIVYDTEARVIRAYRVEYRIDIVQRKMQLKGLPPILWERLELGR